MSYSLKIFLATLGTTLQGVTLVMCLPLLKIIAATVNCTVTTLAAKIGRKIKMIADTFTEDNHYLSTSTNFISAPPATINNKINGN